MVQEVKVIAGEVRKHRAQSLEQVVEGSPHDPCGKDAIVLSPGCQRRFEKSAVAGRFVRGARDGPLSDENVVLDQVLRKYNAGWPATPVGLEQSAEQRTAGSRSAAEQVGTCRSVRTGEDASSWHQSTPGVSESSRTACRRSLDSGPPRPESSRRRRE